MTDFICAIEEDCLPACKPLDFYDEHNGTPYCILHYPGAEKAADFWKVVATKLEHHDCNFRGVRFPGIADFRKQVFTTKADFSKAVWYKAIFAEATFKKEAAFRN